MDLNPFIVSRSIFRRMLAQQLLFTLELYQKTRARHKCRAPFRAIRRRGAVVTHRALHLGELLEDGVVLLEWAFASFSATLLRQAHKERGTSAAHLSQSARPLDSNRLYATLPNRYSTTTIFPTTTQPLSNPDNHREPQPIHNRPSTATQPPLSHEPTILRVESKNDFNATIPHSRFSNHNSTTRKRIHSAEAESSPSWSLGEYAVSIRPGLRSTASLPPGVMRR